MAVVRLPPRACPALNVQFEGNTWVLENAPGRTWGKYHYRATHLGHRLLCFESAAAMHAAPHLHIDLREVLLPLVALLTSPGARRRRVRARGTHRTAAVRVAHPQSSARLCCHDRGRSPPVAASSPRARARLPPA